MRASRLVAALGVAVLGACGACGGSDPVAPGGDEAPADDARPADARPVSTHALGMNDVSILAPLPTALDQPVLMRLDHAGAPLISIYDMASLVLGRRDIGLKSGLPYVESDFHVVAVRVDLCDRTHAGECPGGGDGRLRLVAQPIFLADGHAVAQDIGVHLFYPIPAVELPYVLGELHELAAIQGAPADAPLGISPALAAGNTAYATRLRALILKYATADTLVRLTLVGQERESAAFAWVFSGVDILPDHSFVPVAIPDVGFGVARQNVLLAGGSVVYDTRPLADAPRGFGIALSGATFAGATPGEQAQAVAALTEIQNPLVHDTNNTQCMACHVSTHLTALRAADAGIDPLAVPGRFTSPYNTAVDPAGLVFRDPRVIRAFGWAGTFPIMSQRVANDTAEVLAEIAALEHR